MKKIIGGISAVAAIVISASIGIFFIMQKPEDVKAEINSNFELMEKNLNLSAETVVSSNPFDYTENEYYKNIIAMGTEAIKPLDELLTEEKLNGLYAYLGALAIQEITQCDVYEVTGVDWSNAEEFKNLWSSTMADLPATLNDIQNDAELSIDDKKKETEKYGLFGKAYACKAVSGSLQLGNTTIKAVDDNALKERYKEIGEEINQKDLYNITEYMDFKSVH